MHPIQTLPTEEAIHKTAGALKRRGMSVHIVETGADARKKTLDIIPAGVEVMNMTSVTLDKIGLSEEITESGRFVSARKKANLLDHTKQRKEFHNLRSIPEWTIGSIQAVTEDGVVMVASQSGSQLAAYSFGSDNVVWVVGVQKIVKDLDEGFKRIHEYCLPMESKRAQQAYGVPSSAVNKILIFNEEIKPGRITILLVKEPLGF